MQSQAYRDLDGLQKEAARLAALLEDHPQQLDYLARHLLTDRLGRFSSSGDNVSSTGLAPQICMFTAMKARLSSRQRADSATSR